MSDALLKTRQLQLDDLPMVFSSWLRSFSDSEIAKTHRKSIYFQFHHLVAERCMARPSTEVLVATAPGDDTQILGWLCYEQLPGSPVESLPEHRSVLHFAYTKSPLRRQGVMTALLRAAGVDPNSAFFSHKTWATDALQKRYPGLTYCVYLV